MVNKGDIILISFPFTDLSGNKLRPAVVLFSNDLDVTVCFVTTKKGWKDEFDIILEPSEENGLKIQSLLRTNKMATLDFSLAKGILGSLANSEIGELDSSLKKLFQLK